MNLCVKCVHFNIGYTTCHHPQAVDPVMGGIGIPAIAARAPDGICRPEGTLYQPVMIEYPGAPGAA